MQKILITLLALCALTGSSFAATKKHHATKHRTKHVASSAKSSKSSKSRVTKRAGTHSKTNTRRTSSYQAAPTPERYKEIQEALATKGYFKGEPNGQWGADSVDALRRFQTDQNLEPDGKLGSLSLIALGLGPKRMTAQAKPEPQPATPNRANPPIETKEPIP